MHTIFYIVLTRTHKPVLTLRFYIIAIVHFSITFLLFHFINKMFHDVRTSLIKSVINYFTYCWTYLLTFWYLFLNSFLHRLFVNPFLLCVNYLICTTADAEPELINSITVNVRTVTDSKGGLKELSHLLEEFDDKRGGFVGQRAFLIACSRSR